MQIKFNKFLKSHRDKVDNEKVLTILSSNTLLHSWTGNNRAAFSLEQPNEEMNHELLVIWDEKGKLIEPEFLTNQYYACVLYLRDNYKAVPHSSEGKIYSKEGMIARVLEERHEKAKKLEATIKPGKYLYGPHKLIENNGTTYNITIWDFDKYHGYIDNIDWKTNKLATTKHIIFLINQLKSQPLLIKNLKKRSQFIEITTDPFQNYSITYKYQGKITEDQGKQIQTVFNNTTHLSIDELSKNIFALRSLQNNKDFLIREEVYERLEKYFDETVENQRIEKLRREKLDFSFLKANLFPYQEKGVEFCTFKKSAILADEMGLGKSIQAMSVAILKKKYFDFKKTLIICPASVKYQWKKEIEKFCNEKVVVVDGLPNERKKIYESDEFYFYIINYETTLRDNQVINEIGFDFIILDEAQKIKNYQTKLSKSITHLKKKHGLVITGTPIENKLIDIYGICLFLDKYFITPLWEFSYQHCIFDSAYHNKINAYYNLNELKTKLKDIVLRRQKREVLKDLPTILQQDLYIPLHYEQRAIFEGLKKRLAMIMQKVYKTPFDYDEIMRILNNMRRVSNSTYLIDRETNYSTKLIELEQILIEKLNLKTENKKIIIFSEWLESHLKIEELLIKHQIGFSKLTGKVPAKKRSELINIFEKNDDCKVFLSTEAGGSGLNLQFIDTLINFELPWNPAKKNQRIGRIDRLGQKSKKLLILNLISSEIEVRINAGLSLKENLFESVLNDDNNQDFIDFSDKGMAQFIKQIEDMLLGEDVIFETQDEEEELETIFEEEDLIATEDISNDEELMPVTISDGSSTRFDKEKMEKVMTKGLEFLSGLYEMTTGEKLGGKDGTKVEIDEKTGEVVLRFKFK
jgi:SNF2 family DNA or RNA helicase